MVTLYPSEGLQPPRTISDVLMSALVIQIIAAITMVILVSWA